MSQPFDPPAQTGPDPVGRLGVAVATWVVSGSVLGTTAGYTLHATRTWTEGSASLGLGGALAGGLLGLAAVQVDRVRAAQLGALPGQAHTVWPIHGAVQALPVAAMVPAVLWLSLLVSVGALSLVPVVAGGVAAVVLSALVLRVWSDHRLVDALQALARDEPDAALLALQALAGHPLGTQRARRAARENLGALLLSAGDLTGAAIWYAQVPDSAVAAAGLAVAQAGLGQVQAALDTVQRGIRCPDARHAQSELDAARVLAIWKSEGAAAAVAVADRLDGPGAGSLFRGLHGHLRGEEVAEPSALLARLMAG